MNKARKKTCSRSLTLIFLVSLFPFFSEADETVNVGATVTVPNASCGSVPHGDSETRTRYEEEEVDYGDDCESETQTRICNNGAWSAWSGTYQYEDCDEADPDDCDDVDHEDEETRIRYREPRVFYGRECESEVQTRECDDGDFDDWSGSYTYEHCVARGADACGDTPHGGQEARTRYKYNEVSGNERCDSEIQTRKCDDGDWGDWSGSYTYDDCRKIEDKPEPKLDDDEDEDEDFFEATVPTASEPRETFWQKVVRVAKEAQTKGATLAENPVVDNTSKATSLLFLLLTTTQIISQVGSLAQFFKLFSFPGYKRKKKTGGVVYDANTGQPIPLATISILGEDGKAKETKVSNKYGFYFFLVPPGKYKMKVQKKGFRVVTKAESETMAAMYYPIYTQDEIMDIPKDSIIEAGIPMKREKRTLSSLFSKSTMYAIMDILFWFGFALSIIIVFTSPILYNYVMCGIYLFFFIIRIKNFQKPKWGKVTNTEGTPEAFTFVNSYDENNKLKGRAVTDKKGRYALILNEGDYDLKARNSENKKGEDKLVIKKRGVAHKDLVVK